MACLQPCGQLNAVNRLRIVPFKSSRSFAPLPLTLVRQQRKASRLLSQPVQALLRGYLGDTRSYENQRYSHASVDVEKELNRQSMRTVGSMLPCLAKTFLKLQMSKAVT